MGSFRQAKGFPQACGEYGFDSEEVWLLTPRKNSPEEQSSTVKAEPIAFGRASSTLPTPMPRVRQTKIGACRRVRALRTG